MSGVLRLSIPLCSPESAAWHKI